ncbi:nuclear transport factor 2 family protein [Streptomyces sp. NPDC020800]|uniref:nuclear transport factor 2 family protein n=1 Tax=Streptomyces sp. NPDC020800 TaxID=3365092 RepID=UPI0037ADBE3B
MTRLPWGRGGKADGTKEAAQNITWHVPGRSPLSGDYRGHQEVLGFFQKAMDLSEGTLRVCVDELLTDGSRVVALCTVSAQRKGRQ